ncbi:MAG: FtsX-like permease family protein [Dyella sp.]
MRHLITPLLRHSLMPVIVVAQIALACAIICNTLFLLQQRLTPVLTPDGVSDPSHIIVAWQVAAKGSPWQTPRLLEVESALRSIPGVSATSVSGSVPMETLVQMNGNVLVDGSSSVNKANVAVYVGNHLLETLGLQLIAGRAFNLDEQAVRHQGAGIDDDGTTVITQALANRLFPKGDALGKVIRIGDAPDAARRIVVGIVRHLMRNALGQDNRENIDYSMLFPGLPGNWPLPVFTVRTLPAADLEQVRNAVKIVIERELGQEMVQGIAHYDTYQELRDAALAGPKAAAYLLTAVSIVVLIITLAGIFGMTTHWILQRTHQIGVRRALGARRIDIFRWLLIENALVVSAGVVLGMMMAFSINLWLMHHYELSRLPVAYLPFGVVILILLSQLAVLWPAIRATRISPALATRSV